MTDHHRYLRFSDLTSTEVQGLARRLSTPTARAALTSTFLAGLTGLGYGRETTLNFMFSAAVGSLGTVCAFEALAEAKQRRSPDGIKTKIFGYFKDTTSDRFFYDTQPESVVPHPEAANSSRFYALTGSVIALTALSNLHLQSMIFFGLNLTLSSYLLSQAYAFHKHASSQWGITTQEPPSGKKKTESLSSKFMKAWNQLQPAPARVPIHMTPHDRDSAPSIEAS